MNIIITAPSLDTNENVSGISSVARFIIDSNKANNYLHFQLGKKDDQQRSLGWLVGILKTYLRWLYWIIRKRNALIHFNLAIDKFGLLRDSPLILFARLMGRRIIIHIHGGEFLMHKPCPTWMRWMLRLNLGGSVPKVVLSETEKAALQSKFSCDEIFVLPNCIDLQEPLQFDRIGTQSEPLNILFMGRLSYKKGLQDIYDAFILLKQHDVPFQFFMAGKGPEQEEFVKKFESLLGEHFHFSGVVHGVQKTNLLKKCNVFLLPSFFEGMPIALLEAMSFGLAPVTTDVGSIKYLIRNGRNGIIVRKNSSADIVSAIEKLSTSKELLHSLAEEARGTIFTQYDPAIYIEKLNEIYINEYNY